jgi:hypothetical protein
VCNAELVEVVNMSKPKDEWGDEYDLCRAGTSQQKQWHSSRAKQTLFGDGALCRID